MNHGHSLTQKLWPENGGHHLLNKVVATQKRKLFKDRSSSFWNNQLHNLTMVVALIKSHSLDFVAIALYA